MEFSRADGVRIVVSIFGVFSILVGTWGPWVGIDFARSHPGNLLFWGAIWMGIALLVELLARRTGAADQVWVSLWSARVLGGLALVLSLLFSIYLPFVIAETPSITMSDVSLTGVGGALLLIGSSVHLLLG